MTRMTAAEYTHLTSVKHKGVTPETLLKQQCVTWLALNGWLSKAWFQQGMVPKPLQGMPDRVAIKGGVHVWIEFKVPGRHLRPMQVIRHAELEAAGATVLVIHSLDELISELRNRGLT